MTEVDRHRSEGSRGAAGCGPLTGTSVLVLGGIGAVPFAAMVLADLGADVVLVDRPGVVESTPLDAVCRRGQQALFADMKCAEDRELVWSLMQRSDVLLEGFRPGVADRLGFGPNECIHGNRGLIYGRMTGWGQHGPLAQSAGHDITYLALSGALGTMGSADAVPRPPLNLLGDFAGGAMFLVVGILAALVERNRSGHGQVVDAAMLDGVATLLAPITALWSTGRWHDQRDCNFMDGSAPFYRCYATSDGGYMAVGAVEPAFYQALLDTLGISGQRSDDQWDRSTWPRTIEVLEHRFRQRTREQWTRTFADVDACVAPVLSLAESVAHPQAVARHLYDEIDGILQAAPAPRFSRSGRRGRSAWARPGEHSAAIRRSVTHNSGSAAVTDGSSSGATHQRSTR